MPTVDSKMRGCQSVNNLRISVISYHNKFFYPNKVIGIFLRSLLHRVKLYTILWNFFQFFLRHHRNSESRRKNLPFVPCTSQLYRLKDRYFIGSQVSASWNCKPYKKYYNLYRSILSQISFILRSSECYGLIVPEFNRHVNQLYSIHTILFLRYQALNKM